VTGDPTSNILISLPNAYTAFDPGRYTDGIQVLVGALEDVYWVGNILVAANPFLAGVV
jgi:hypothetical protein